MSKGKGVRTSLVLHRQTTFFFLFVIGLEEKKCLAQFEYPQKF